MLYIQVGLSNYESISTVQEEIVQTLKGLCGAPSNERDITVGTMTGRISFRFSYFLSTEIPEIKKRLQACKGLNANTLVVLEDKTVQH